MINIDQSSEPWNEMVKSSRARWAIAFCLLSLLMVVFYLPYFFQYIIYPKQGILLHDLLLNYFIPLDWSLVIFPVIYVSILQTIFSLAGRPRMILIGLTSYFVITIMRMASMYILTLEPPTDIIILIDPVTLRFYPEGGFTKDLFFSGHVSTMTLLIFLERNRLARWVKLAGTLIVGVLLIWQHVHYTLDVITAPMVTIVVFFSTSTFLKPHKNG